MAEQKYKVRPEALTSPLSHSGLTGELSKKNPPEGGALPENKSTLTRQNIDPKRNAGSSPLESGERSGSQVGKLVAKGAVASGETKDEKDAARIRQLEEERQQQSRKLRLIKECEGVLLVNYDWLDMPEYPSNDALAISRRHLEYSILINVILGIVCIMALSGWVPAWAGGSALGLFFVSLCVIFTPLRTYVFVQPSYRNVIKARQALEFQALGHIRLLEGKSGLAWRLANLAPYNGALKKGTFQSIIQYSRAGKLLSVIKRKSHIRLYLLYLLEAERAYKLLKDDYFSTHRDLQARGIDDTL